MMNLSQILGLVRRYPDYFGAVSTGYLVVGSQVVVQILLVPFYLSALGMAQFGILMMLMTGVQLAFHGISWSYGGVLRILAGAESQGDRKGFARGYAAMKLVFCGYGLVVGLLGGGLFWLYLIGLPPEARGNMSSREVTAIVIMAAIHLVVLMEFSVDQMALNATQRQTMANSLLVIGLIVFLPLVFVLVGSGLGVAGVFLSLALSNLVARIGAMLLWRRQGRQLRWAFPGKGIAVVIGRYGHMMRQGYLAYGLLFMAMQADILIVGLLGGATLAAQYVLIWKIAEILVLLLWRVSEALQPMIVKGDIEGEHLRLHGLYSRGAWGVRALSVIAGGGYALLGPWLVMLWVGDAAPAYGHAYLLAGGAIAFLGSARFPAIFAYGMMQLGRLVRLASIELALKWILILLLFSEFGLLAPLMAINLVHGVGIALLYARLPRFRAI